MDTRERVKALASSFSTPPRKQTGDDTPPIDLPDAHPLSDSPYSKTKRELDRRRGQKTEVYWLYVVRQFWIWKKQGISLLNPDGTINVEVWTTRWRNIKYLPHKGLTMLKVLEFLGGSYSMWLNMQRNYYHTDEETLSWMAWGEEVHRTWKNE